MRFVHISDPHVVPSEKTCQRIYRVECNPKKHLIETAIAIASLKPEFVVVTGDIAPLGAKNDAELTLEAYLAFLNFFVIPLRRIGIRVFTIPGNHDINKEFGMEIYRRFFGRENYSVAFPDGKLLFITPEMKSRRAKPSEELMKWLSREVVPGTLVFSHYPLHQWKRKDELLELFSGNVRGFFAGHLHRNAISFDGVPQFETASLSGSWWNLWNDPGSFRLIDTRTGKNIVFVVPRRQTEETPKDSRIIPVEIPNISQKRYNSVKLIGVEERKN